MDATDQTKPAEPLPPESDDLLSAVVQPLLNPNGDHGENDNETAQDPAPVDDGISSTGGDKEGTDCEATAVETNPEEPLPPDKLRSAKQLAAAAKSQPVDLSQVALILHQTQRTTEASPAASPVTSPNDEEKEGTGGVEEENEEGEGGAHDTITSLAGAKMLQKYRKQIRGHHVPPPLRRASQDGASSARLEHLFKEEPLLEEEEKCATTDDEGEEEGKEHQQDIEEDVFVPPDGGYGWFVTLGAFICLFWTAGWIKSYGVVFAELMKMYPDKISVASWIPAAMTTTSLAMAPIASALCQKLNCRVVTATGSLLCAFGIAISAFMPNLEVMFFTLGILSGAGIGLCTTPGIILTARYFDKKRSRANALCLSGTAAGSFSLPLLIQYLFSWYGFRGALLIMGSCMLHVCISAALYRPLAVHVCIVRNQTKKQAAKEAKLAAEKAAADQEAAAAAAAPNNAKLTDNQIPVNMQTTFPTITTEADISRVEKSVQLYGERAVPTYSDTEEDYPALITPISSSYPLTGGHLRSGGGQNRFRYSSEDFPLARNKSLHSSFDSISMMSSVSNRSVEKYVDSESNQEDRHLLLQEQDCNGAAVGQGRERLLQSQQSTQSDFWAAPGDTKFHVGGVKRSDTSSSKSLSLRDLAFHQIGSHLNLYKTMLLGQTSNDSVNQPITPESTRTRRSSFMFSCEDIMVDSTSILKDSRHPSHTHLDSGVIHRVVSLNRNHSVLGSEGHHFTRHSVPRRQRYYSECERSSNNSTAPVSRNVSFCNLGNRHGRVSLIGSSELIAEIPETPRRKFTVAPAIIEQEIKQEVHKKQQQHTRSLDTIKKYIDLSLCRDPVFLLLAWSVMMMAVGMPHCLFFLPTYAKSVGVSSGDASFLLSLCAIADLAGRLTFGFVLDLNLFPKYLAYASMMLLSGVSAITLPSATSFTEITVVMSCYGIGTGSWFLMVPLLLAEFLGVERIGSSYGLVRLFQSVTNLCGPIVAGHLFSSTGTLGPSFYFMGSSMCLGAAVILFLPLAVKKKEPVLP